MNDQKEPYQLLLFFCEAKEMMGFAGSKYILHKVTLLFYIFIATITTVHGQSACNTLPGLSEATCTGCTLITGNTNINSGDVACFNGTSLVVGAIAVSNGGTLQICSGTLTVNSLRFNGGSIIVNTGAILNIGIDPLADFASATRGITNYGTINVTNAFTLNGNEYLVNNGTFTYLADDFKLVGTNTLLQNNENGVMNLKSVSVGSNAIIINGGEMNVAEDMMINSNGAICLLKCATVTTQNMFNEVTNSVFIGPIPSRPCIRYTGNAEMNAPLTDKVRLSICKATGATISGGAPIPFGGATVINDCASCQPATDFCELLLPITFQSFEVTKMNSLVQAAWTLASDVPIASCSLEGSSDGIKYTTLKTWNSHQLVYDVTVANNASCLFRIKAITSSGSVYYSVVKTIDCADLQQSFVAWTQPATNNKQIQLRFLQQVSGIATISIADAHGRKIHSMQLAVPKGVYTSSLDLNSLGESLPHGIYFVTAQFKDGQLFSQKLVL